MTDHTVTDVDELEPGERITVQLDGREVTIFNINDELFAYLNWCMHQSGPVCEGDFGGTVEATFDKETLELNKSIERDGEILYCPWHGFQYDIKTGECLSRESLSLPSYPVKVEDGKIIVSF